MSKRSFHDEPMRVMLFIYGVGGLLGTLVLWATLAYMVHLDAERTKVKAAEQKVINKN